MRWQSDYQTMLKLLAGSKQDRKTVYDWLILKVTKGEELNFGYRRVLEQLHAEFSG